MKLSAFKNFVLFKPRTRYACRQCHCSYKIVGDTWLETLRSVRAVDGSKAFRIFWLCHSGHKQFRGYSKPVSWKKNLGGDVDLSAEAKTYEEEDEEVEKEYEEMVKYAERKKNAGGGKLYH